MGSSFVLRSPSKIPCSLFIASVEFMKSTSPSVLHFRKTTMPTERLLNRTDSPIVQQRLGLSYRSLNGVVSTGTSNLGIYYDLFSRSQCHELVAVSPSYLQDPDIYPCSSVHARELASIISFSAGGCFTIFMVSMLTRTTRPSKSRMYRACLYSLHQLLGSFTIPLSLSRVNLQT